MPDICVRQFNSCCLLVFDCVTNSKLTDALAHLLFFLPIERVSCVHFWLHMSPLQLSLNRLPITHLLHPPFQIALASVNAVQTGCVSDCFNKGNCSQNTQDPNQIWVMIIWLTARRAEKSVCPVLNVRVRTFSRRHTLIRVCDLWGWLH